MKKIIVTGGAGFIGLSLVRQLLNAGHSVFCLDDFSKGLRDNDFNEVIKLGGDRFRWANARVQSYIGFDEYDEIYHLAAAIGTKELVNDPKFVITENISMMYAILEQIKDTKIKLLYTSTAEVMNGLAPRENAKESDPIGWSNPYDPRWAYAYSKFTGEMILRSYGYVGKFDFSIARLSNVYGPRMCNDYVVKSFCNRLLKNENPFVVMSPNDTRPFCYVSDVVRGLILLMEMPQASRQTINLAEPEPTKIIDLAKTLVRVSGKTHVEVLADPAERVIETRSSDITKAKNILKWSPYFRLYGGLKNTYEWYKNS